MTVVRGTQRFAPTRRAAAVLTAVVVVVALSACSRAVRQVQIPQAPSAVIAELWQEPTDISGRNLLHGPGGERLTPREGTYLFVAEDTSGWSPGFDVRDSSGVTWSVKLGPEAQSEVITSRILWAIGFHQPPTYYVDRWHLSGAQSGPQAPGRFRPDLSGYTVVGDWSWYENPFVGMRPYGGLIVANLILNNWDWKTSNNKIYQLPEARDGARRWFVVRDVGASLGRTTYPAILKWFRLRGFGQGTRNNVTDFEAQGFITRVREDGRIEFDYRGIYRDVINTVTLDDVRWTCELMSRLSDEQWHGAFRAGGYGRDDAARFIAKIKSKIAQGLDVSAGRAPYAAAGR
jgi:hypothetical protein